MLSTLEVIADGRVEVPKRCGIGAQLAVRRRGSYTGRLNTAGEALLPHARSILSAVDNWSRQWSGLDPTVAPMEFATDAEGRMLVNVHQVVRNLEGDVLSDGMVEHAYTIEEGLVRRMDVRWLTLDRGPGLRRDPLLDMLGFSQPRILH